ncbi:MAG: O-antigen biosynthesis protein, partial [Stenotrophomonas sp.]
EKTGYSNYQLVLVDNGAALELRQWMQKVETLAADRVQAFAFDPPLPHAAACNLAAAQSSTDYLLFLRPEVAALQPQWLDELLNHGLRPEVGVVGAKTVSGEGKLTHAGLVPGLLASGGHAFAGAAIDAPGYMNRLQVAQQYSAVADSCLLIGKALFAELDGFDHATFSNEGADVDLCLRARALGYLTVWTPHALLLHSS